MLVTAGLTAIVYATVSTSTHGWASAHTATFFGLGLALIVGFLVLESRTANALVPLRIFRIRSLSASNVVAMGLGATLFSLFYFATLYLQIVLGFSALRAGVAFLPASAALVIGVGLSTRFVPRIGPRIPLVAGPLISAAGLYWFSHLAPFGSFAHNVLFQSLVVAFGIGVCFMPVTLAGTSGVEAKDAGLASGLLNASRQVGAALGLAALATVAASRTATVFAATHGATRVALTAGYSRALSWLRSFRSSARWRRCSSIPIRRSPTSPSNGSSRLRPLRWTFRSGVE